MYILIQKLNTIHLHFTTASQGGVVKKNLCALMDGKPMLKKVLKIPYQIKLTSLKRIISKHVTDD
jgi:hypothetical protein